MRLTRGGCLAVFLAVASPSTVMADGLDIEGIVATMQASPTGPFLGVRWFCRDGSVLPPRPFACEERGGGRQHGQWRDDTLALREQGYLIGNVLAALDPETLAREDDDGLTQLTSILVERFLIARDDGWIWRQARDFRGILQEDDEREVAAATLRLMLEARDSLPRRLVLVREAVRLLPGQAGAPQLYQIRGLSNAIAEADPDFAPLRNRIHTHPTVENANEVRAFAMRSTDPEGVAQLAELAALIDEVYGAADLGLALQEFASTPSEAAVPVAALARALETQQPAEDVLAHAAATLRALREHTLGDASVESRLNAVRLSLQVEALTFAVGRELHEQAVTATRGRLLQWLEINLGAAFGAGLLTEREFESIQQAFSVLRGPDLAVAAYRRELAMLNRASQWAARRLALFFAPALERFNELDTKASDYIPDRLRGSPLLLHAELLGLLEGDAQALAGVESQLFGKTATAGVRPLNAGLAQGRLSLPEELETLGRTPAIVITDETTADLPAVAGIITAQAGNAVSHVQLLARSLGVPNVVLSGDLLKGLAARRGESVFLAVSPGGVVRLAAASAATADLLREERAAAPAPLRPNVRRLDLKTTGLLSLGELRAEHSGRLVGPKAANLGELAIRIPGTVSPGLAIPFGRFRALLELPYADGESTSMYDWMKAQYKRVSKRPAGPERDADIARVLREIREWLRTVPLPAEFLTTLSRRMTAEFGEEGSYGVFVRSDTNVEDLPNFSGAGLNKTVPNVVGFDETVSAIRTVWASAFTERAWGWRQAMVPDPIHVYPAVLLHRSVDVETSGVMLTVDPDSGDPDRIYVAANEGPGGGVAGQTAEAVLLSRDGGFRHLASATEPYRLVLEPEGGVGRRRARGFQGLIGPSEREQLLRLDRRIRERCLDLLSDGTQFLPADVEFGFSSGRLVLFQIRPVVEDPRARRSKFLAQLDAPLESSARIPVPVDAPLLRASAP